MLSAQRANLTLRLFIMFKIFLLKPLLDHKRCCNQIKNIAADNIQMNLNPAHLNLMSRIIYLGYGQGHALSIVFLTAGRPLTLMVTTRSVWPALGVARQIVKVAGVMPAAVG